MESLEKARFLPVKIVMVPPGEYYEFLGGAWRGSQLRAQAGQDREFISRIREYDNRYISVPEPTINRGFDWPVDGICRKEA